MKIATLSKTILQTSLMAVTLLTPIAGLTQAQDKPIVRMLVGFPPGVGTDNLARMYAEALSGAINVSVVVDNRPGAGGMIAAQALKQATPESNSLMFSVDHQVVMLPLVMKNPGFDVKKTWCLWRALSTSTPASLCQATRLQKHWKNTSRARKRILLRGMWVSRPLAHNHTS